MSKPPFKPLTFQPKPVWTAADHIAEAQKLAAPENSWDEYAMNSVDEMADPESVQLSIAHSLIAIAMQGQPQGRNIKYIEKATGEEKEVLEPVVERDWRNFETVRSQCYYCGEEIREIFREEVPLRRSTVEEKIWGGEKSWVHVLITPKNSDDGLRCKDSRGNRGFAQPLPGQLWNGISINAEEKKQNG